MENKIVAAWIFKGEKGQFSSGVFTDKQIAEEWIKEHNLTGILTWYPINVGVYDWAIENGFFTPLREKENSPDFIGAFSSASQEHYHYVNGNLD